MINLKREKVAVLCDTKDKIRKIYKMYNSKPCIDIFECYNPSKLYIGWDANFNALTWDSYDDGYFVQCDYKLITFDEFIKEDKMREFKVGDKVRIISNEHSGHCFNIGDIVILTRRDDDGTFKGNEMRGGWIDIRDMELVEDNNYKSIHITFNDTTTHAVLKDGKDVIKRAKVGLYHEDEYKFETGVIEVVKKLLDIKDDDKEEVKPFVKAKVGDVIRIVKYEKGHYPEVKLGDIHKVTEVYNEFINTNKDNSFEDCMQEYEIIEPNTSITSFSTSEILDELKRRLEK